MFDGEAFHYRPTCSMRGCVEPAAFKVAALWSDGTSRELKNYGLACDAHRDAQLARARTQRAGLNLTEGESVGPVELFAFVPGTRDVELPQVNGA